jgi:hypothetical protein
MGRARERYQPRHAEASVFHGVIREHLDDFLRAAADRADGAGLPFGGFDPVTSEPLKLDLSGDCQLCHQAALVSDLGSH